MNSSNLASWLKPAVAYVDIWRSRPGQFVPGGATEAEINDLKMRAAEVGLYVPPDFVTFLQFVNGTSFNGFAFAGAAIPKKDLARRSDLLSLNNPEFDAHGGDVTLYAISSGVTHGYFKSLGRFREMDGTDVRSEFRSFSNMAEHVFAKEVENLKNTI